MKKNARINLKKRIQKWKEQELTGFIVFDTETNGLFNCSVLSISAIKYERLGAHGFTETERFNRFYFPREDFNEYAIDVNGLNRKNIIKNRKNVDYPQFFCDDINSFEYFCKDIKLFVAHNIQFDVQFVPFLHDRELFCTMLNTREEVNIFDKKGFVKNPKLSETAKHYNIPVQPDFLHSSMYDTEICARIFLFLLNREAIF